MEVRETGIKGLKVIVPSVFQDTRGYFFESYHREILKEKGIHSVFIQDNQSRSNSGVIRGLHFQNEPNSQTKLVRVTEGLIWDVAVDLRKDSPTYANWFGLELSADNHLQLLIPKGFAHGFSVLSAYATLYYKCDSYYHPESEAGIRFDDPDLGIDWKLKPDEMIISEKDRSLPYLNP